MSIWDISDRRYHRLLNTLVGIFIAGCVISTLILMIIWITILHNGNLKVLWLSPFFIIIISSIAFYIYFTNERNDIYDEEEWSGIDEKAELRNENKKLKKIIKMQGTVRKARII